VSTEPTDLDQAEKLAAAATPGPWTAKPPHDFDPERWPDDFCLYDASGYWIASHGGEHGDDGMDRTTAEFIAAARSLVPALIAEVRQLRAENHHFHVALATPDTYTLTLIAERDAAESALSGARRDALLQAADAVHPDNTMVYRAAEVADWLRARAGGLDV
jgi:hypothetical protein